MYSSLLSAQGPTTELQLAELVLKFFVKNNLINVWMVSTRSNRTIDVNKYEVYASANS